jgi:hypothetical protein
MFSTLNANANFLCCDSLEKFWPVNDPLISVRYRGFCVAVKSDMKKPWQITVLPMWLTFIFSLTLSIRSQATHSVLAGAAPVSGATTVHVGRSATIVRQKGAWKIDGVLFDQARLPQNLSFIVGYGLWSKASIVLRAESHEGAPLTVPNISLRLQVAQMRRSGSFLARWITSSPMHLLIDFDSQWDSSVANTVDVVLEGDPIDKIIVRHFPSKARISNRNSEVSPGQSSSGRLLLDDTEKEKTIWDTILFWTIVVGAVGAFLLLVACIIVSLCSTDKCALERAARMRGEISD